MSTPTQGSSLSVRLWSLGPRHERGRMRPRAPFGKISHVERMGRRAAKLNLVEMGDDQW